MSIQAIAWVLENSEAELADRLVLLAIANHCDATWGCYPSLDLIAREAKVHRGTVWRSVRELVRLGELAVCPGGRGRGNRSTYQVAPSLGSRIATLNQMFTVADRDIKGRVSRQQDINRHEPKTRARKTNDEWQPDGALAPLTEDERRRQKERLAAVRGQA